MSDLQKDAAAVADVVTGPGTPDQVKVTRPATGALWSLFAGMGVTNLLCLLAGLAIFFGPWPQTPEATHQRLFYLGWTMLISVGCNALFAFAIASPWVGKVTASAGGNSVSLDAR